MSSWARSLAPNCTRKSARCSSGGPKRAPRHAIRAEARLANDQPKGEAAETAVKEARASGNAKEISIYCRNMSVWGPATLQVLKRQLFDVYAFPETHKSGELARAMLGEVQSTGHRGVASSSRPSARSKDAGGVLLCARSNFAATTYRHMAQAPEQQLGWRQLERAASAGPVDFHDFAVLTLRAKGLHIHVLAVYLGACVGIAGNSGKLAKLAAFTAYLDGPWVMVGDWNVAAKALQKSAWASYLRAVFVVPPTSHTSTAGLGAMYDYAVMSESAADLVSDTVVDDSADSQAHYGFVLRLRADVVAGQQWQLDVPRSFAQPGRERKAADPSSKRSRKKKEAAVKKKRCGNKKIRRPAVRRRMPTKQAPTLEYIEADVDSAEEEEMEEGPPPFELEAPDEPEEEGEVSGALCEDVPGNQLEDLVRSSLVKAACQGTLGTLLAKASAAVATHKARRWTEQEADVLWNTTRAYLREKQDARWWKPPAAVVLSPSFEACVADSLDLGGSFGL